MKYLLKLTYILALCLSTISCNEKGNELLADASITATPLNSKNPVNPFIAQANPSNPYDFVGALHNEIMLDFLNTYSNQELSIQQTCDIALQLANSNENFVETVGTVTSNINAADIEEGIADFENNFHGIIEAQNISNEAKTALKGVVDHLFELAYSDLENAPDQEGIEAYLLNFENQVVAEESYSQTDSQMLLSASATARYSTALWYNYYGPKTVNNPEGGKAKIKWWGWVVVGVSDLAGAIIGGEGGPAGAILGGVSASKTAHSFVKDLQD